MNQDLYNHNIIGDIVPPTVVEPWVRNPEWLEMPEVLPTERKIVILQRINPAPGNFFGLNMTVVGGYTIDWGDGTSNTYASAASAGKRYEFDSVPGTPTSEGFKQVFITITPVIPTNVISALNFAQKSTALTTNGQYSNGALDMIISVPGTSSSFSLGASSALTYNYPYLERVQIIASALTSYSYIFGDLISLKSASITSSAVVTSAASTFWNCNSLEVAPELPWSTFTSCPSVFDRCYNLKSVGVDTITTPSTSIGVMFSNCRSLVISPKFILTAAGVNANNTFYGCSNLKVVPQIDWEKLTSTSYMFYGCSLLSKVGSLSMPLNTSVSYMFQYCYKIQEIGELNLPACTTLANTFQSCSGLVKIGRITTGIALTNLSYTFSYCSSLREFPEITNTVNVNNMTGLASNCVTITIPHNYNTSNVTTIGNMYELCERLKYIPDYDLSKVTVAQLMVTNCPSLDTIGALYFGGTGSVSVYSFMQGQNSFQSSIRKIGPITFNPAASSTNISSFAYNARFLQELIIDCSKVTSTANVAQVLTGCPAIQSVILTGLRYGAITVNGLLSREALIALFESLGTAAGAQTLTVSGNWGWPSLTADDKLIATSKGWTLA